MVTEMAGFEPYRLAPIPDDYVKDEVSAAYAEAWEEGIWVAEFGRGPNGTYICGVGSYYHLQQIEHDNGLEGDDELDPSEFTPGECLVFRGWPGSGETRLEAITEAIGMLKDSPDWTLHEMRHEQVTRDEQ